MPPNRQTRTEENHAEHNNEDIPATLQFAHHPVEQQSYDGADDKRQTNLLRRREQGPQNPLGSAGALCDQEVLGQGGGETEDDDGQSIIETDDGIERFGETPLCFAFLNDGHGARRGAGRRHRTEYQRQRQIARQQIDANHYHKESAEGFGQNNGDNSRTQPPEGSQIQLGADAEGHKSQSDLRDERQPLH